MSVEPSSKSNDRDPQNPILLKHVVRLMRAAHGLDVGFYDDAFLGKTLEKRVAATTNGAPAAYLERLADDRAEAKLLIRSLNICYSEFFRNPLTFAEIEQLVLPSLVEAKETAGRSEIRIWSAGCAGGQEAWSVAILMDELIDSRSSGVSFRIIATDLSEAELAAARAGIYGEAAMQNVRMRHLRKYFTRQGDSYTIAPRLRARVNFSSYDLLDRQSNSPPAGIFGDFDLVLCCNLLFYYRPEVRAFILDKIWRCLSPRGFLVTGEAELAIVKEVGGYRLAAAAAPAFQKAGKKTEPQI